MKHLLILISILLLSSPVIGDNHKGETLYLWKTSSGELWKGFGDKETHSVYKGDVNNGVPNGLGVLIYPDERKYVGEFKNGKYHGQGTLTSPNGNKYEGEWKNDEYHGQGILSFSDGGKYVGEQVRGLPENGTYFDKNGNIIYKWVNGRMIKQ